ncbi:M48 family peptidase [Robertkochia marina]|uniref:M48 family peptidase n=1 Tax=Robertkochia marina TaxID=1227945 RepID=A0A4S3M0T7_9FLAO|nr:M48 family metallopeptidase [Robertkochia marina]THD67994.1 M48 family peptidase [Robertkochia marina]TRZ41510.1 M48 family peptidase [Robertkochia marina]
MKKLVTILVFIGLVVSCKTNPFTGKKTLNFQDNSALFPSAFQQYDAFLAENEVIRNTEESEMIKRVGQRIKIAAEQWFNANGYQGYLNDYRWEYNLVKSEQLNAWCMPGGKIVFYTGILPVCETEAGIAAVMGHEVAHALVDHGAQRMSASTIQKGVLVAGNLATMSDRDKNLIFNAAYGVGSTVGVMLPFSRSHENEADLIGQRLMAIAGYDPMAAANLWERMAESGNGGPPEILSTHPSSSTRIQNLRANAPNARAEAASFGVTEFQN